MDNLEEPTEVLSPRPSADKYSAETSGSAQQNSGSDSADLPTEIIEPSKAPTVVEEVPSDIDEHPTIMRLSAGRRISRAFNSIAVSWLMGLLAAGFAGFHYVQTVHPGVGPTQQAIDLQTAIDTLGIAQAPGYPVFTIVGKLFSLLPWGLFLSPLALFDVGQWGDNPAWRLNLLSVVFSMVTVFLMARLVHRLTNNVIVSTLGALFFAFSLTFWQQSSTTSSMPLLGMLLVGAFLCLVSWQQTRKERYYFASAFLIALSFGVNVLTVVVLPAWLWAVMSIDYALLLRPRNFSGTLLAAVSGALVYLFVPLRAFIFDSTLFCKNCPQTWLELTDFLFGRTYWQAAFSAPIETWLDRWAATGFELTLQFWPLGLVLAGVGLFHLLSKNWRMGITFCLLLAGTTFFVVSLDVDDWAFFMMPVYLFFAPLVAVGTVGIWERFWEGSAEWTGFFKGLLRVVIPIVLLAIPVALVAATFLRSWEVTTQQPGHDMVVHWWARDLLDEMPEESWLLVPPQDTAGFIQTSAVRYVSWSENVNEDITLLWPEDGTQPPGPFPGYAEFDLVKSELQDHPLYAIELNDERLKEYALLPISRDDGWTIGYQIVGERTDSGIVPWVDADRWSEIESQILLP